MKFKVGQRVFSPIYGWGYVREISDSPNTPVIVKFTHHHWSQDFTLSGQYILQGANKDYDLVDPDISDSPLFQLCRGGEDEGQV